MSEIQKLDINEEKMSNEIEEEIEDEIEEENENEENEVENEDEIIDSVEFTQETFEISSGQSPKAIKSYENEKYLQIEEENEEEIEEQNLNMKIESSVRYGFIKKVYGILSIQLIITFLFVLLFQLPTIKKLIFSNLQLTGNILIYSLISFICLFLILICSRELSKTVPYNYIILLGITLSEALSCSIVSACYSFEIVAISLFLTIVSTLSITIYSCTTKSDFSYLRVTLLIIFSQLFMVGFISIIFRMKIIYTFYTFLSTITVGIYLVYDTQLIMGKFGYSYSVDDYIFASLEIYMDIIRLFLLILRLIAQASSKRH